MAAMKNLPYNPMKTLIVLLQVEAVFRTIVQIQARLLWHRQSHNTEPMAFIDLDRDPLKKEGILGPWVINSWIIPFQRFKAQNQFKILKTPKYQMDS